MADNLAKFIINGSPSEDPTTGDPKYFALNSQTLILRLETLPSPALSVLFEVYDPYDPSSPVASYQAPLIMFNGSGTYKELLTDNTATASITMPATGAHSYLIRCTVSLDTGPQVFERLVATQTPTVPALRKTVPAESQEARYRGWSDDLNLLLDVISSSGASGAALTQNNKNMQASATSSDEDVACSTGITATPANNSYVMVFVNGIKVTLGNGVKTNCDCYFSADGGTTAKAISAIIATDLLYWIGSYAGYELATTDRIDFEYIEGVSVGGGEGAMGFIYITDVDVQSTGVITNKVYQDAGGNTILQSFTTSTTALTFTIYSSYPLVTVGGVPAVLSRYGAGANYVGDVNVTIGGSGDVLAQATSPDGDDAATDTTTVTLSLPPELQTLSFTGGYPGSQTELKEDDNYGITGTTDKNIDAIEVYDYEAGQNEVITGLSGTSFSEQLTIADRGDSAVLRPARIRARDAVTGAWGPYRDTDQGGGTTEGVHLVNCNNLHPPTSIGIITYPGVQQALKSSESATVANTCSSFDTITYSDPTGTELNIANPTTYETSKSVTRIGGNYNVSTVNFRITANRAANDATTVVDTTVNIANVAAQITVTEPYTRLRSGGNNGTSAQDYSITLTSNQQLLSTPTLNEESGGGNFIDSWTGGPSIYTRTLRVHDDDTKGIYTWQSLSATNLAGIVTTTITGDTDYILGGFVARNVMFPPFSQEGSIDTEVVTYAKLQGGLFQATNQQSILHAIQGDHADADNEFTIDSPIPNNPQTVWWNDYEAAMSSSGNSYLYNLEEVV